MNEDQKKRYQHYARIDEAAEALGLSANAAVVKIPSIDLTIDASAMDPDRLAECLLIAAYGLGKRHGKEDAVAAFCAGIGAPRASATESEG